MFEESPFTGACSYASYEVLVMLLGTFLLGLLLGYLIWGWLGSRIRHLEDRISIGEEREKTHAENVAGLGKRLEEVTLEREKLEESLRNKDSLYISSLHKINQLEREMDEERRKLENMVQDLSTAQTQQYPINSEKMEEEAVSSEVLGIGVTAESLAMASEVFGKEIKADDLQIIEGIGPKTEEVLRQAGVNSWARLAEIHLPVLRIVMEEAGPGFNLHKPRSWPRQAGMAARGEWKKLKLYQEKLVGGVEE